VPVKYAMAAPPKHPPARMTLAEFFAWDPEEPSIYSWQLIDGEPVAMAPATENHGALQIEIGSLLRNHLLARGGPCRVIAEAGIVPRVRSDRNYRIPDLGVTCAPPSARLMVTEPILLIEILSPSNEVETWANIWAYTTIPSVAEILIVSSTKMEAELLRRRSDASWPETPERIGADGNLRLESIDFTTELKDLYRTTTLAGG
jgi:Uma2 family endonuclease